MAADPSSLPELFARLENYNAERRTVGGRIRHHDLVSDAARAIDVALANVRDLDLYPNLVGALEGVYFGPLAMMDLDHYPFSDPLHYA